MVEGKKVDPKRKVKCGASLASGCTSTANGAAFAKYLNSNTPWERHLEEILNTKEVCSKETFDSTNTMNTATEAPRKV